MHIWWLVDYQYEIYGLMVLLGFTVAFALFFLSNQQFVWDIIDLFWIVAGGASAVTALIISIILADVGNVRRVADLYSSRVSELHSEAKKFLVVHCSDVERWQRIDANLHLVSACFEVLSVERLARYDSKLVRFTEALSDAAIVGGRDDGMRLRINRSPSRDFSLISSMGRTGPGTKSILALSSYETALKIYSDIRRSLYRDRFGNEFIFIMSQAEGIRSDTTALMKLWDNVSNSRYLFLWRIIALSVLALVLPLRIGKSVASIRQRTGGT